MKIQTFGWTACFAAAFLYVSSCDVSAQASTQALLFDGDVPISVVQLAQSCDLIVIGKLGAVTPATSAAGLPVDNVNFVSAPEVIHCKKDFTPLLGKTVTILSPEGSFFTSAQVKYHSEVILFLSPPRREGVRMVVGGQGGVIPTGSEGTLYFSPLISTSAIYKSQSPIPADWLMRLRQEFRKFEIHVSLNDETLNERIDWFLRGGFRFIDKNTFLAIVRSLLEPGPS